MRPIPMDAPYGGVNDQIPVTAIQSPQCEYMLNFNPVPGGVALRNGDALYGDLSLGSSIRGRGVYAYGNTRLFAAALDGSISTGTIKIYDVETGDLLYTSAGSGTDSFLSLYFNDHLFLMGFLTYQPGFVYNGSNWSTIGWTGTNFKPYGGDVYNNRAYLIQKNEAAYWYTDIEAISGAVTKVDLTTVVSEKTTLAVITPITVADTVQTVTYQAFVFFSGEVLFYEGSYPNSASWRLVGRGNISAPLNYMASVSVQGDALILCESGVVSLRDLFLKGSQGASSLSVNARIQNAWRDLIRKTRAWSLLDGPLFFVKGVWDPPKNRVIISFGYNETDSGEMAYGSYFFILDTLLGSWYFHQSYNASFSGNRSIEDITTYKNKVVMLALKGTSTSIVEKEGATGFTDRDGEGGEISYLYKIKSAPVANGRAFVSKAEGLDIIVKSDLHTATTYRLIRDFGVEQTQAQTITGVVSGSLQKPFANIGIEGSYIQYQIEGETAEDLTVGYQLYGTNLWIEPGGSPR